MDPRTYCERAIDELRGKQSRRFSPIEGHQMVVVLAHFAQVKPSERDFSSQLKLLVQSAERSHRWSLAAAARAVLEDWQARTNGAAALPAS
jgi:hypothetical protein